MKINREKFGWIAGALALFFMSAGPVLGADGDPDAKQEVRDVAAISKLKKLENISLFYVKGMT